MLTPEGLKKQFDNYRKWFSTLLIREFLNLPIKEQNKFIIMVERFLLDCRKVYKEATQVTEKIIIIRITEIEPPDNRDEDYKIIGIIKDTEKKVEIKNPATIPLPEIGSNVTTTLFSLDKKTWYSSKQELITKGR